MSAAPPLARIDATRTAVPAHAAREFSFDASDFERVRRLILARAGISLNAGKQAMVYSRLARRLRDTGQPSFAAYLQSLEAASSAAGQNESQEFINCLTTNLTSFFREEHHFSMLADALKASAQPRPRIWCSAASTGEEAYSIAMTAAEALGPHADVQIVASDIDTQVLAAARLGTYPADARGLSPQRLQQHFLRGTGANSGRVRIKPDLARRVEFRVHNLAALQGSPGAPFDIVFCRNVLIYFDPATQRSVLESIHRVMKPGGLIFVGHSESFTDLHALFRLRGKTVYERL